MSETVSLREFLEAEIRHERELRRAQEKSIEQRLAEMNELREQITAERGSFVLREMFDAKQTLLEKRISEGELKLSEIGATRLTLNWLWGAALAALALAVAVGRLIATWHR